MFDLFRNREKTKKFMMGGILLLVSASMLLYLVPSYNTGVGSNDAVVAKVGDDVITEAETRRMIQNQMKGRQIPAEIIPNYVTPLVDQMITDRALEYEARKLGIQVSDQDVADYLRQNFGTLFQDGKFVGKDVYAAMLQQQGLTIEEFEGDLKRQMLVQTLRKIAMEGSLVTPAEIVQEYKKKNDQVQLQYVKLMQDKYKKEAEPTTEAMQQYYNTNKASYTQPETRNVVILLADGAKIETGLSPTDADLQATYNQNLANFRMPERVHVRHILLMTRGKPDSEDAKIKAKAEDLVKQLRGGADFAELAKKNSEDNQGGTGGSAAKGGDLDWITRGQTEAPFEQAAFSLKPMAISDPVKTVYGYHIIQVLAHEDAHVKPFAEVKDDLAKQWKEQRANIMMQKISDTAQALLQKTPGDPDKVASALGMQVVRVDNVQAGQTYPEIGASADLDQAISALKKGEVSQPISPAANKVVVAEVTAINPPRPSTFDEVKTQIHDTMVTNKVNSLVQKYAKDLEDAAKANGGDLAKAAKAMGLEVKTTDLFKRGATVDGIGSANYVDDAFTSPVGTLLAAVPMGDGTLVAKVTQRADADMSKLPEQRDQLRDSIKGDKARDRNALFESGLVDMLTKEGVIKMHPEVISRIISSFKSSS